MDQTDAARQAAGAQSSIRSFFAPRSSPSYAAPPDAPPLPVSSATSRSSCVTSTPLPSSITPRTAPAPAKPNVSNTERKKTPSKPLPLQASVIPISAAQVTPLKRINALLLEIAYPDSFYHKIQQPASRKHANFSRAITWAESPSSGEESKLIGGCVCRLDFDPETKTSAIYIQSLSLLSPWRGMGLATAALEDITAAAILSTSKPTNSTIVLEEDFPITSLYAHVWSENTEGLEWYTARGFTREGPLIQGYYRRLKPDTAWLYRRAITPSDHLRQVSSHQPPPAIAATIPKPTPALPSPTGLVTRPPMAPPTTLMRSSVIRSASYQTARPATEWNDLPSDILVPSSRTATRVTTPVLQQSPNSSNGNLPSPLGFDENDRSAGNVSGGENVEGLGTATAKSGGTVRGKKKRVYPNAAFAGGK
jgi:ribosomal protein S18 acetylase RimI-like enzyme